MIGYLEGETKIIKPEGAVILVNGVGYDVYLPTNVLSELIIGKNQSFYIYNHVREDQISLYGFISSEELDFFKMLLSVSGIGPKVALAIISSAPTEKIKHSISSGDPGLLSAVSGVGKKTAEKAVVELRGKLGEVKSSEKFISGGETEDVCSALMGLGFRRDEILEGIKKLPENLANSEEKIKWLLKNLGGK